MASLRLVTACLIIIGSPAVAQHPEPEPEPSSEPEPEPESAFAEPDPEWEIAKQEWGLAWQVHIYLFGVLFALTALYSMLSIIRLYKKKHLLSQPYFIALNSMVFFAGLCRSLYLLIDAYNSNQTFPDIAAYLLYATVFPCLTSAFSLMFMALLAATKMTFISKSVTKVKVIVAVILVHFVLSITSDVLMGSKLDARVLLFVCQVFYLTWGLLLFFGFMVIFHRLNAAATLRQKLMNKHLMRKLGLSTKQHPPQKLTLSLAVKVTLISAIMGLCTVGLVLYGMIDVYGVFRYHQPAPWQWWAYHTALRVVELILCLTISYVATQPFRYHTPKSAEDGDRSCDCYVCAPCWSWCSREHSYLLATEGWSEFNTQSDWVSDPVKRQESQKGDFPLHHVMRRYSQDPSLAGTTPHNTNMLKADHGQLHFTTDHDSPSLDHTDAMTIQNPNYYHSSSALHEQATLKIDRDMADINETSNLLSKTEIQDSREELNRVRDAVNASANNAVDLPHSDSDEHVNMTGSQVLTDRVSQLSYELESGSDTESNGLLAEV